MLPDLYTVLLFIEPTHSYYESAIRIILKKCLFYFIQLKVVPLFLIKRLFMSTIKCCFTSAIQCCIAQSANARKARNIFLCLSPYFRAVLSLTQPYLLFTICYSS